MGPPEENKKSLSFGFFKKREAIQLRKSAVGDHEEKEDTSKDFVVSLEGKELKSTKAKSEVDKNKKSKKEYVIPLINQNRWRTEKQNDNAGYQKESDNLDLQAAEEILKQSAMLNDEWDKKGSTEETTRSIPLLMQNKVPDGFETDSKLDVKLRPEEPNNANYDEIPIEHFGMAMLRGMGWDEGRGVGRHGKVIAPVEAQIRPKGLGLGAEKSNKEVNKNVTSNEEKGDQMDLKKGSYCVVTIGANKGLYGIVEGIDEDNSRVMVKLTLGGKTVNLMQYNIDVISKKEYEKFSKYLNKQKVDKYKKDEEERVNSEESTKQNGYDSNSKRSQKRQQVDEEHSDSDDLRKEHKKQRKQDYESSRHHKHSKSKHKSHKKNKNKKYDREKRSPPKGDKRKQSESSESEHDEQNIDSITEDQRKWLQQDLRVRVVDRSFKSFYKEKVIIVDVPVPGLCVCKASDGKVLDGISQSSLETVIPRDDNSFVLIVSGSHRGQVGQIMKRDKDQCLAIVQLLSDRDTVLKLGYDEVCEYVGDVHSRDDY